MKIRSYDFLYDFFSKNALTIMFAESLSKSLTRSIQWDKIEWQFYDWFKSETLQRMIRDEILRFLNQLQDQWHSPEQQNRINSFLATMKKELKPQLQNYLHEAIPSFVAKIIRSKQIENWIRNDFLPQTQPKIELWIQNNGKALIIAKLNIANRVRDAIDKQDVKQFHEMITQLASEHLGAIQVLGYILGLIVGLLQLMI